MADLINTFKNTNKDVLKKILDQKKIYGATKDPKVKAAANKEANRLRTLSGIKSDGQGVASASQLQNVIDNRGVPAPQAQKTSAPRESIEQIINRNRKEKEVANALARQQQIAQGTTQLQGSLDRTQGQLNQQTQSLDPRFGGAKASAVAGTRVAQNRLSNVTPFSGQQSGRTLRQAQGIETGLQNRQSELDTLRSTEEADIAFRGQEAVNRFNTGQQSLQQGATLNELQNNIRANEIADTALLDQARVNEQQEFAQAAAQSEQLFKQQQIADERDFETFKIGLNAQNDATILQFKNELEQDNALLDSEIQFARDNNQFQQEQVLQQQKLQNEAKLEGIRQSGRINLENLRTSGNLREIEARNAGGSSGAPSELKDAQSFIDGVESAVNIDDISEKKRAAIQSIINQPQLYDYNDADKLLAIMQRNFITPTELDRYEAWRESAINAPYN